MRRVSVLPLLCLLLVGCKAGIIPTVNATYADRLNKTAVEPLLAKEVTAFPADAQRVKDILDTWESRLRTEEASQVK